MTTSAAKTTLIVGGSGKTGRRDGAERALGRRPRDCRDFARRAVAAGARAR